MTHPGPRKQHALSGMIPPYFALNGTFDTLCTWFVADDRITLTP